MPPKKRLPKTSKPVTPTIGGKRGFRAVHKARAALLERASEILDNYLTTVKLAAGAGEYDAALKSYQWLLEHIPADEGKRIVDINVDKQEQNEGPRGPLVQIGFKLGGVDEAKSLPEPSIESVVVDRE